MRTAAARLPSALGAAHVVALAVAVAPCAARAGESAPTPWERPLAQLQAELALARGDGFYLRLDTRDPALELRLKGVALVRYPVTGLQRGVARVAFRRAAVAEDWDRIAYSAGRLEPEPERDRVEIEIAAEGSASATPPPIPQTAEESWSVPGRWRVVFAEGLILEVGSRGGARHRGFARRASDALARWRADWRSALDADAPGRLRLRVELAPEDAAALYRSLPPDVALVLSSAGSD